MPLFFIFVASIDSNFRVRLEDVHCGSNIESNIVI